MSGEVPAAAERSAPEEAASPGAGAPAAAAAESVRADLGPVRELRRGRRQVLLGDRSESTLRLREPRARLRVALRVRLRSAAVAAGGVRRLEAVRPKRSDRLLLRPRHHLDREVQLGRADLVELCPCAPEQVGRLE